MTSTDPSKPRLVIQGNIYHGRPGGNDESIPITSTRQLERDEQPFYREITIGPDWQAIEHCWVTEAALVVICNQEAAGKMIEVGFVSPDGASVEPHWRIRPQTSLPGEPLTLTSLRLRCPSGPAKCTITVIPA